MLKRSELYKTREYWIERIQNDIFRALNNYKDEHKLKSNTALAEKLCVSKGYVSQIMNGNFNFSISKLVDLALTIGVVPAIDFEKLEIFSQREEFRLELMINGKSSLNLEDISTIDLNQGLELSAEKIEEGNFELVA